MKIENFSDEEKRKKDKLLMAATEKPNMSARIVVEEPGDGYTYYN